MSASEVPEEPPHDILATEAYPVPSVDPALRHETVRLPEDLTGSEEPRDVLAAEEFAMPAPPPGSAGRAWRSRSDRISRVALRVALALTLASALRRLLRARRTR